MSPAPRRRQPRPMAAVMANVIAGMAPTDPLARLQLAWPQLAGRKYAEHSAPSYLRSDGTIVVRCESGTLASELALREPQLTALIVEHLQLNCPLRFEGPAGRR